MWIKNSILMVSIVVEVMERLEVEHQNYLKSIHSHNLLTMMSTSFWLFCLKAVQTVFIVS